MREVFSRCWPKRYATTEYYQFFQLRIKSSGYVDVLSENFGRLLLLVITIRHIYYARTVLMRRSRVKWIGRRSLCLVWKAATVNDEFFQKHRFRHDQSNFRDIFFFFKYLRHDGPTTKATAAAAETDRGGRDPRVNDGGGRADVLAHTCRTVTFTNPLHTTTTRTVRRCRTRPVTPPARLGGPKRNFSFITIIRYTPFLFHSEHYYSSSLVPPRRHGRFVRRRADSA